MISPYEEVSRATIVWGRDKEGLEATLSPGKWEGEGDPWNVVEAVEGRGRDGDLRGISGIPDLGA